MALKLEDRWIWDSWYAKDGDTYHAFYLCASRGLGDPERRHRYTNVGHAVSRDLVNWEVLPDALSPSDSPAFDSWTTWTGSVVQDDSGLWWMFYTGTSREDSGEEQKIGAATSPDLMTWTKVSKDALVAPDSQWYEKLDFNSWHDEAWRDPFVFKSDDHWKMLITARSNKGDSKGRGVVGLATSDDLLRWKVEKPISTSGSGFGQLEVLQYAVVDGVPTLLFCCGWTELEDSRKSVTPKLGGVYSLAVDEDLEEVDISSSIHFPSDELYACRLVQGPDGGWNLIGFRNLSNGEFVGELSDPIPVTAGKGGLVIRESVMTK